MEWIKLWQARIRDFEPEVETQGARADDRMVIIAERSGRVMLHFCSLTLVRTVHWCPALVQGALVRFAKPHQFCKMVENGPQRPKAEGED